MRKSFLLSLFFLLMSIMVFAQEEGHSGYSPMFCPVRKAGLPKAVDETSGLFFYQGRLWTHNDSGGKPVLYGLDTVTFEIVQKITLGNAKNKDWEDVCIDDERVYIGDFGNNNGNRKNLKIYTFLLSEIPEEGDATVLADSICFAFADQKDFNHKKHEHDFDCESIFATEKNLYLFSKGWETGTTRLYRLSKKPGNYSAEVVNGFDSQGLITGADYDRKNGVLVLVGYVKTIWMPFIYLIYDFDDVGVKLSNHRFELPSFLGTQTEGICFYDEGRCYLSSETSPVSKAKVYTIDFRDIIAKDKERNQK